MLRLLALALLFGTSVACVSNERVTLPHKPPLVVPVTFRFEVVLFDVPFALAE